MKENGARKAERQKSTIVNPKKMCEKVTFVNLSKSARGLICRDTAENGISKELGSIRISVLESKIILRQIINICIRSTYHVFCKRDKDWTYPELLTF